MRFCDFTDETRNIVLKHEADNHKKKAVKRKTR